MYIIYRYTPLHAHVCVCVYICVCIYMYMYICVCMYIDNVHITLNQCRKFRAVLSKSGNADESCFPWRCLNGSPSGTACSSPPQRAPKQFDACSMMTSVLIPGNISCPMVLACFKPTLRKDPFVLVLLRLPPNFWQRFSSPMCGRS